MSTLDRDMPGKQIVAHSGIETKGNQGCCTRNKAVENNRNTAGRRRNNYSNQTSDLQATNFSQHINWIIGIRFIVGKRTFDNTHFVGKLFIVNAGATPGDEFPTGTPVRLAVIALAAVVLPMPISPIASRSTPRSIKDSRTSMPTAVA